VTPLEEKPESRGEQVLGLIALCGELPSSALRLFSGNDEWTQKAVRTLIQRGLVKSYQKDGVRALRMTKRGWRLLEGAYPARYAYWHERAQRYCGQRSDLKSRLRTHRIAEALVLLSQAGITLHRDQKPELAGGRFQGTDAPATPVCYSSVEIKDMGDAATRIKATRAVGLLLCGEENFLVYNSASALMKWSSKAEQKLIGAVDGSLELAGWRQQELSALMLGTDMSMALPLLQSNGKFRRQCFSVDETFPSMLYAPLDAAGCRLVQLYCSTFARHRLRKILLAGRDPPRFPRYPCDYEEDSRSVLLACEFDLQKIVHFKNGLELFDERGVAICFEFQREPLEAFLGDLADIRPVPSSLLEETLHGH